ncbi:hypothetical protein GGI42DRAFT_317863 [Trichoderma sp. SZMC 28013]
MLGFETSADSEAAEKDLQDLEVCGCAVRITRQDKAAVSRHIYLCLYVSYFLPF